VHAALGHATLYDLCARNVLAGGVPYRDVFDTNPPGMLWLHLLVRTLFGWSSEALRLADFVVFALVVALLALWLRRDGRSPTACVWTAFALVAFYFGLSEWCHCQRDTWMLLPALGALWLHRLRLSIPAAPGGALALAEGVLWGGAFWVKPFVALPALACWLTGLALSGRAGRPWRADAAALAAGALLALAPGLAWLWRSGSWPPFCNVLLHWDPEYNSNAPGLLERTRLVYRALRPWGFVHLAAVPVAVVVLVRAVRGWAAPPGGEALLAAFSLGWLVQAAYVQKGYDYSLASALPPALALVAGRPWWPGRFRLGWAVLAVFAALAAWRHPLLQADRPALWVRCWQEGSSPALRDRLKSDLGPNAPDWADLERVADYLRRRHPGDGEVTCYNNTTHPLYLALDLRPSTPFLHFNTVLACFPSRREEVRRALAASRQRYVVSDLRAVPPLDKEGALAQRPGRPLALPPAFPGDMTGTFPWSLPVVFRAGRYLVHEAKGEVGPLMPTSGPSAE
jgi:hypothetical protein